MYIYNILYIRKCMSACFLDIKLVVFVCVFALIVPTLSSLMLIHNQLYKIVELNRAVTILLQLVISVLQACC